MHCPNCGKEKLNLTERTTTQLTPRNIFVCGHCGKTWQIIALKKVTQEFYISQEEEIIPC